MSDALPKVLSFRAQRLMDDISRSTIRVPWTASGVKAAGESVVFNIPPVIADLRSLKIYFEFSMNAGTTAYSIPVADAIIQQVDVSVSGYSVTQLQRYGKVVSQLKQLTWPTYRQSALPQTFTVDAFNGPAVVQGFAYGALSGSHNRYMDFSLFRNTVLQLQLVDPNVIGTATGGTVAGVSNAYLVMDCVQFAQDTYRRALRSVKQFKLPFKHFSSFVSPSFTTSIDFPMTKATLSLDKIITFRVDPAFQTTTSKFYLSTFETAGTINAELGGMLLNGWALQEAKHEIRTATDMALAQDGPSGVGGIQSLNVTTNNWRSEFWASVYNMQLPGAAATNLVSGTSTYDIASPLVIHVAGTTAASMLLVALEVTKSISIDTETGELAQTE